MTLLGVDISNNNGLIDWETIPTDRIAFVIIKLSEGTFFADSFAPANWAGAASRGLARLAYHFARPDRSTAADEAAFFLRCLTAAGGARPGDGFMLDMEMSPSGIHPAVLRPGPTYELQPLIRKLARDTQNRHFWAVPPDIHAVNLQPWCLTWLQAIESVYATKPLLYSGLWFMQPHGLTDDPQLAEYGLNLAAYQTVMPPAPPQWPFLAMWQETDQGSIPGISGPVDLDVFNGDADMLRRYGVPIPVAPAMTNDDYAQTNRLLLGDGGALDPAAAIDYLKQFKQPLR